MPTYQYACTACDHRFEAVQKFTDDSLTVCPECGGTLRKVYGSVGVVFKGSGWYRNDSRGGPVSPTADAGKSDKSSEKSAETSAGTSADKSATKGSGTSGSDSAKKSAPAAAASSSGSGSGSASTGKAAAVSA